MITWYFLPSAFAVKAMLSLFNNEVVEEVVLPF